MIDFVRMWSCEQVYNSTSRSPASPELMRLDKCQNGNYIVRVYSGDVYVYQNRDVCGLCVIYRWLPHQPGLTLRNMMDTMRVSDEPETCLVLFFSLRSFTVSACDWNSHFAYMRVLLTRKKTKCMNGEGGAHNLPMTYDRLLVRCSSSTSRDVCLMKFAVGKRNVAI